MTNTNRGPDRWMRAAVNAAKNPNSSAARLYQKRVQCAREFAEKVSTTGNSHVFAHLHWSGSSTMYHTCSVYCAAMMVQLDLGESYVATALATPRVPLVPRSELSRDVRCMTCGTAIKKEKARS